MRFIVNYQLENFVNVIDYKISFFFIFLETYKELC